jgi:hypothetical protein
VVLFHTWSYVRHPNPKVQFCYFPWVHNDSWLLWWGRWAHCASGTDCSTRRDPALPSSCLRLRTKPWQRVNVGDAYNPYDVDVARRVFRTFGCVGYRTLSQGTGDAVGHNLPSRRRSSRAQVTFKQGTVHLQAGHSSPSSRAQLTFSLPSSRSVSSNASQSASLYTDTMSANDVSKSTLPAQSLES